MKRRQVALLAAIQGSTVLGFAVPLGIIVGVVTSFSIIALGRQLALTIPNQAPPPIMVIPWDLVLLVTIGSIGACLLGVLAATIRTVRVSGITSIQVE